MSHINELMEVIHQFENRTVMRTSPTHVVMHPRTELDLMNLSVGPPRATIESGHTIIVITVMNAKMRIYRSFDVEPGKFIVG